MQFHTMRMRWMRLPSTRSALWTNPLYELPDDLGGQFPDVGILPHQVEEPLHIDVGFLLGGNQAPQFGYAGFERFLLILVVRTQLHKTLVADYALKVVLRCLLSRGISTFFHITQKSRMYDSIDMLPLWKTAKKLNCLL